jgi:hypothetical protein
MNLGWVGPFTDTLKKSTKPVSIQNHHGSKENQRTSQVTYPEPSVLSRNPPLL